MSDHCMVENRSRLALGEFDELERYLAGQTSVRHVLLWLAKHEPPLQVQDMITQDEFSHDILIPFKDGQYIVYESS